MRALMRELKEDKAMRIIYIIMGTLIIMGTYCSVYAIAYSLRVGL